MSFMFIGKQQNAETFVTVAAVRAHGLACEFEFAKPSIKPARILEVARYGKLPAMFDDASCIEYSGLISILSKFFVDSAPADLASASQLLELTQSLVNEMDRAASLPAADTWVPASLQAQLDRSGVVLKAKPEIVTKLPTFGSALVAALLLVQQRFPEALAGATHLSTAVSSIFKLDHCRAAIESAAGDSKVSIPGVEAKADVYCVTGATGYLASHLVRILLAAGFTVRGTVRSTAPEKVAHLTALPGASERLSLVECDLLAPGAFDEAVAGCMGVYHTASPFILAGITDPEAQLYAPAIEGTLNVLRSCEKAGTVKRVVLTSSTASIYFDRRPATHFYTEDDWSDESFLEETKMWYAISKIRAERAAWDFVKALPADRKIDLITINPTWIIGPALQPVLNTSLRPFRDFMTGQSTHVLPACKTFVDVRDVAQAHMEAMVRPEAEGRLLMIAAGLPWMTTCDIMRKIDPELPIASEYAPVPEGEEKPAHKLPEFFSQAKAQKFGIVYTPVEQSLKDTMDSIKAHGFMDTEKYP